MNSNPIRSVCPYCGVGCGILMEVEENKVVRIKGDPDHPANFGRLCTKGGTAAVPLTASGRLSSALFRSSRESEPYPVDIDQAILETASRLNNILREHGPDSIAFYVSGQMSLEAQYLVNKLAKGFIRTNNIEANSRLCMASAASGYKLSLGADGPPGSYEDIEQADLFLVTGANMADCHPILFLRMMDRVKAGAKLIVVDPRRTATAEKADLYLPIRPGTDLAFLNGMLHLLIKNGQINEQFIAAHTAGFEAMPEFLENYRPKQVAEWTGISEEDLHKAADWIGSSLSWMSFWTMGLNQSTHGTWHTNAICNLHLATGAICKPGSGPFSLTGQPNAMGGREMGYMGPGLPGQRALSVEADRSWVEELWNLPQGSLRTEIQPGTVSLFERMNSGDIKACWIICTNPAATIPNRRKVIEGLKKAELVITQDAFAETETNHFADIILPAALWAEAEGVMINSERNITLMQKAVEPPGDALPDWQIIARVACAMGFSEDFSYNSAGEVYAEIQKAWNPATGYDLRGADYSMLREGPVQWPCEPEHPERRNPIRYRTKSASTPLSIRFPTEDGRAVFWARPYLPPAELPDEQYPFVLNTGRVQHQWHTLTKTGKVPKLNKLNPGPFLEIHPEDAAQLDLKEGNLVRVSSRRGAALLPAVITDRVQPGSCFAPIHWNDQFGSQLAINEVTNDAVDPVSLQPELKHCSVSLVKAETQPAESERNQPEKTKTLTETSETSEISNRRSETTAMLANMLGLSFSDQIELTEHEQAYLSGFLKGMENRPDRNSQCPELPASLNFDSVKRSWVNGLLAGLFADGVFPTSSSAPVFSQSVTIVWASQTGNAEEAAHLCARKLRKKGISVELVGMDTIIIKELQQKSLVLFAVSTFGAGDPPDQGQSFFQALQAISSPILENLKYAVLAFGDSSYDSFCAFGKNLDSRLNELGAKRLLDCTCCDTDYMATVESWLSAAAAQILQTDDTSLSPADQKISLAECSDHSQHTSSLPATEQTGYNRKNPFSARLLFNRLLNQTGSRKETRQYSFDLRGSGLTYEAGDSLGIWPMNNPNLVEEMLQLLGFDGQSQIRSNNQGKTLGDALLNQYDIHRITPGMLQLLRKHARNRDLDDLLNTMTSEEQTLWLSEYKLIDLIQEFPADVPIDEWIRYLRPLQPRLYSISSSSKLYPDEVHITVSTVRYSYKGRERGGVCSTFLADQLHPGGEVRIFIQRSPYFRPPSDSARDIIMIGPGTGIAPFRGFLQERKAIRATGRNWLFFGEQQEATDFYYKDQLEHFLNKNFLHRLSTAFSRDQNQKIYVQHRMLEQGAELWRWMEGGAFIYVCGDAAEMARSVDQTLLEVLQINGGMNAEQADSYLNQLRQNKRYIKDVY